MINELKNFNADRLDLDELVALSAFGRVFQAEVVALGVEEPDWLAGSLRLLRKEVSIRQQDRLEKLLYQKKSRLQSLKPAVEKRAEIEAEIKFLELQLK
jgi:hypothetical protein